MIFLRKYNVVEVCSLALASCAIVALIVVGYWVRVMDAYFREDRARLEQERGELERANKDLAIRERALIEEKAELEDQRDRAERAAALVVLERQTAAIKDAAAQRRGGKP